MKEGKFIVIEGIDGAGSTTHAHLLVERLWAVGKQAVYAHEPTVGFIGASIRKVLEKRQEPLMESGKHDWRAMALLFAADRVQHCERIKEHLAAGTWVVSDRYLLSSMAYQGQTADVPMEEALIWLRQINQFAIQPFVTFVLQVEPVLAAQRRAARGREPELYETSDLQYKLGKLYKKARDLIPPNHWPHLIDANGEKDVTAEAIWRKLKDIEALEGCR